jgi:cobalamin-dependent methionine synthase I
VCAKNNTRFLKFESTKIQSNTLKEKSMLIVGELINASRKAIATAIEAQNPEAIQQVAKDQIDAGADYIDVNALMSMPVYS